MDRSGRALFHLGLLGWSLAAAGRTDDARRILDEFAHRSQQEYAPTVAIAWLLAELGENDRAWELLAKADEEHQPMLMLLGLPDYRRLRSDPRFTSLAYQLGLPVPALGPR